MKMSVLFFLIIILFGCHGGVSQPAPNKSSSITGSASITGKVSNDPSQLSKSSFAGTLSVLPGTIIASEPVFCAGTIKNDSAVDLHNVIMTSLNDDPGYTQFLYDVCLKCFNTDAGDFYECRPVYIAINWPLLYCDGVNQIDTVLMSETWPTCETPIAGVDCAHPFYETVMLPASVDRMGSFGIIPVVASGASYSSGWGGHPVQGPADGISEQRYADFKLRNSRGTIISEESVQYTLVP